MICDRRLSASMKRKVYKMVVKPAILYSLETVPLTKKQVAEQAVAELKMLRFSLGVTRMDRIKDIHIRQFGDKVRRARLRWFGHAQRQNAEYIGRKMCPEPPGKRRRGRPMTRFTNVVREDMRMVRVTDRDTANRGKLKTADPLWRPPMGATERRHLN